jgi:hypothetical protein
MALVPFDGIGALLQVQGKSGAGNVSRSLIYIFCSNGQKFLCWYTHQASVNEAPGLPLNVGLMGELVENKEVGHEVAAEGFKGPALDPSAKGGNAK